MIILGGGFVVMEVDLVLMGGGLVVVRGSLV
jgi:hypothetical protein